MVDKVDEAEKDETEVKQKKSSSTMVIIILSILLASLVSGGLVGLTIYLLSDDASSPVAVAEKGDDAAEEGDEAGEEGDEPVEAEVEKKSGPVEYFGLDPKFVVSFRDQKIARFMQFTIQIMTRDKEVIKQIQQHNPAIRSSLLLLFDGQTAEVMNTREGKEQLLVQITEDMNKLLEELAGVSGVEAAYFESFLLQ